MLTSSGGRSVERLLNRKPVKNVACEADSLSNRKVPDFCPHSRVIT